MAAVSTGRRAGGAMRSTPASTDGSPLGVAAGPATGPGAGVAARGGGGPSRGPGRRFGGLALGSGDVECTAQPRVIGDGVENSSKAHGVPGSTARGYGPQPTAAGLIPGMRETPA